MYLSVMDLELRKVKVMLTQHNVWSAEPVAITLITKIDNLQHTKASLTVSRGVNFDLSLAVFVNCTLIYICLCSYHFHLFLLYIHITFFLFCLISLHSKQYE